MTNLGLDKHPIVRISASKIMTLNTCPKQFYYHYDYTGSEDLPKDVHNVYAYRGSAVHSAVDKLIRSFPTSKVSNLLEVSKVDFVDLSFQEYRNICKSNNIVTSVYMESDFIKDFQDSWETIQKEMKIFKDFNIESEVTFNIKLPDFSKRFPGIKRKYSLFGTVDFILTSPKGEVIVLDGKTSGTVGKFVDDDQIRLYMYMVYLSRNIVPSLGGFLYFLKGKTKFIKKAYCSPESIKGFKLNIVKFIKTVEKKVYNEKVKVTKCNYCTYRTICEPYLKAKESRKSDMKKAEESLLEDRPSKFSW